MGDVIFVDDFNGIIDGIVVENPIKIIGNGVIKTYNDHKNKKNEEIQKLKDLGLTVDDIDFNIIKKDDDAMLLKASYNNKLLFYIFDDMVGSNNRIDQYNFSDFIKMWESGKNFKDGVYAKFRDLVL